MLNLDAANWHANIGALAQVSGIEVHDYASYIAALEQRRAFFKQLGARATDHAAVTPYTGQLSKGEADAIFQRALHVSNQELIVEAALTCDRELAFQAVYNDPTNRLPLDESWKMFNRMLDASRLFLPGWK